MVRCSRRLGFRLTTERRLGTPEGEGNRGGYRAVDGTEVIGTRWLDEAALADGFAGGS